MWEILFACVCLCKASVEIRVGMGSGISRDQIQRNLQSAMAGLNLQDSLEARTHSVSNCKENIPIYEQDIADEFPEGVISATGPTKNIQCRCQPITVYEGNNEYNYEVMHCKITVRPKSDQESKVLKRLRYPPQMYDDISGQHYLPMGEHRRARLPFYIVFRDQEEYLEPRVMYNAPYCRQNFMTTIEIKYNSEAPIQRSQSFNNLISEPVGYIAKNKCTFGTFILNEESAYLPPDREVEENEVVYVWNEDLWKLQPGLLQNAYHISKVICIPAKQLREHAKRTGDSTLKFKDPMGRLSWIDFHLETRAQRGFRRIFRDYTAFIVQNEASSSAACASAGRAGPLGLSSQAGTSGSSSQSGPSQAGPSSSIAGTSGSSSQAGTSQAGPSSNAWTSGSSSQAGTSGSSSQTVTIDTSPVPTDGYPSVSPSLPPFGFTNAGNGGPSMPLEPDDLQQSEEEYLPFGRFTLPESPPAPSSPQSNLLDSERSDASRDSSPMTPPGLHESRSRDFDPRSPQQSSPSRSASPLTPPGFSREESKPLSDHSTSGDSEPPTPPGFKEISSSQLNNRHFNIILIIVLTSIICTQVFYKSFQEDELRVEFLEA